MRDHAASLQGTRKIANNNHHNRFIANKNGQGQTRKNKTSDDKGVETGREDETRSLVETGFE